MTPPVVSPPEVLPAQVRVVKADAKHIDKCGRASDLFKVAKRSGVVYTSRRQGAAPRCLAEGVGPARSPSVPRPRTRRSQLQGKQVWKISFTSKACAQAPEIAPNTGS